VLRRRSHNQYFFLKEAPKQNKREVFLFIFSVLSFSIGHVLYFFSIIFFKVIFSWQPLQQSQLVNSKYMIYIFVVTKFFFYIYIYYCPEISAEFSLYSLDTKLSTQSFLNL